MPLAPASRILLLKRGFVASHGLSEQVVPMELTHEQLASLLTQLDAAQQQLDALS